MRDKTKKIVIGFAGGFVLFIGVAMIVLPGPAFIVIPAGLAILATEFEWARRWLHKVRDYIHNKREAHRQRRIQRREQRASS